MNCTAPASPPPEGGFGSPGCVLWWGGHSPAQTSERKGRTCPESTGLEKPSELGIPGITSLLCRGFFFGFLKT